MSHDIRIGDDIIKRKLTGDIEIDETGYALVLVINELNNAIKELTIAMRGKKI